MRGGEGRQLCLRQSFASLRRFGLKSELFQPSAPCSREPFGFSPPSAPARVKNKSRWDFFFTLVGLNKPGFNNIQGGHRGEISEIIKMIVKISNSPSNSTAYSSWIVFYTDYDTINVINLEDK